VQEILRACDVRLTVPAHISEVLETNKSLCQQLDKAKRKAGRLEQEVEQLKETLREKTLALDRAERELHQARRQAKEQHALPPKNAQERKDAIKQAEELQEQLSQLQSENVFLRQQLGEVRNKAAQEHKVSDAFICEADKVEKEVR